MENYKTPEQREEEIDALIEALAQAEGMNAEDIFSDIATFAEICKEDDGAKAYFEELAEKINLSLDEMMEYANRKIE